MKLVLAITSRDLLYSSIFDMNVGRMRPPSFLMRFSIIGRFISSKLSFPQYRPKKSMVARSLRIWMAPSK